MSLSEKTDCKYLIYATESKGQVEDWLAARPMKPIPVENLKVIENLPKVPHVPYTKSWEEAKNDPFAVLHTSGSTGIPKPIIWKQALMAAADAYQNIPTWNGYEFFYEGARKRGSLGYCPMPLFHAFGLLYFFSYGVFWGEKLLLGYASKPVSYTNTLDILKYSGADAALLPPSIVVELTQTEEGMAALKKLSYVVSGGGAISKVSGDKMAREGITFLNAIGSTEFGIYPIYFQSNKQNWEYFIFNDDLFNSEYIPLGDGLYEHVIKRKEKIPQYQGVFITFPDSDEFRTGDIYTPHPTLPHHWLHCGRNDDIIVFSNGEKLNPVKMETSISRHPDVRRVLVVGQGKFEAGLIIDPIEFPKSDEERQQLIDSVWPYVKEANSATVKHGRISKHLITLSNPDKPFTYSGKGELQKGSVKRRYKDDIDALYENAGAGEVVTVDITSDYTIVASIKAIFEENLGSPSLEDDADFSAAGIDSLQIINGARLLTSGLKAAGVTDDQAEVSPRFIYQKTTPRKLGSYVFARITLGVEKADALSADNSATLAALLEKYAHDLPTPNTSQKQVVTKDQTILLTGSTGSLGAYLLDILEKSPNVAKIVCLNRATNGGKDKQPEISASRGLSTTYHKTEFLQADLSLADFGLSQATYSSLLSSADQVVHNAWPVNFNMAVESFDTVIHGVRSLVDFANAASKNVSIVFLSSIGTVDGWMESSPIPETQLTDFKLASGGYGQSKLISSLILDAARERSGVPSANIRVGQIAGSRGEKGLWNKQEWLPSIVASSVKIGKLPDGIGGLSAVGWMPIEDVAAAVVEIGQSRETGYFNLTNPKVGEWSSLTPVVTEYYSSKGKSIELVSFKDWIDAVEGAGEEGNPAYKLLGTYRGLHAVTEAGKTYAGYKTDRSQRASEAVREMGVVTGELFSHWLDQWAF